MKALDIALILFIKTNISFCFYDETLIKGSTGQNVVMRCLEKIKKSGEICCFLDYSLKL